jgi:hypothetical protein
MIVRVHACAVSSRFPPCDGHIPSLPYHTILRLRSTEHLHFFSLPGPFRSSCSSTLMGQNARYTTSTTQFISYLHLYCNFARRCPWCFTSERTAPSRQIETPCKKKMYHNKFKIHTLLMMLFLLHDNVAATEWMDCRAMRCDAMMSVQK